MDKPENIEGKRGEEEQDTVPNWLFMLFISGFVMVLAGVIIVSAVPFIVGNGTGGAVSGGVVIFIGPFPIVIGVGPGATWLVLIGVILTAISIIIFVISRRKMMNEDQSFSSFSFSSLP